MKNSRSSQVDDGSRKRKAVRWPIVVLALAVLAAAGWGVYTKAIAGWLTTDVTIETVTVTDGSIEVVGDANGWVGVKDVRCTTDEDTVTLYVTAAWPVLHSDSQFAIIFDGDYSDIIEINVSDDRNALVIWTAD